MMLLSSFWPLKRSLTSAKSCGLSKGCEAFASLGWALVVLLLLSACAEAEAPEVLSRDCRVVIFYQSEAGKLPTELSVVGDFNYWDKDANPLVDKNGDGVYLGYIEPPPGPTTYRIWNGRSTQIDVFNPLSFADWTGRESSYLFAEDCSQPALSLVEHEISPQGRIRAQIDFLSARSGAPLDRQSIELFIDETPFPVKLHNNLGEQAQRPIDKNWRIELDVEGLTLGKHHLRLEARDSEQKLARFDMPFWIEAEPFTWDDAIIYQLMVDRFRKGNGVLAEDVGISYYHGGDLWGVVEAIEEGYFQSMGANTIWLSPIYENPDGEFVGRDGNLAQAYHGYWAAEPRSVEQRFGGEEAMDALVAAAHKRGIRVILDFVLNHVHQSHPYWQQHAGPEWFSHPDGDCICGMSCPWHLHMTECWFDPFLPDFRWDNMEVAQVLLDDAIWWVERFDLDGLRLDAVPMMPRYAMRLLRDRIRQRFESSGAPFYLLGETYTMSGEQEVIRYYLGPTALSGQFDFPVMWALRAALAGRSSFAELDHEVSKGEQAWTEAQATMAPILGNHDVPRFVSDVNGDMLWDPRNHPPETPVNSRPYELLMMAWTFLLAQNGAPVIYYGDEIGLAGAYDPDNRRNMRFDGLDHHQSRVLEHVRKVGSARRCSNALRRGERTTLLTSPSVYAFSRDAGDGYPAVVFLNRATTEQSVVVRLPVTLAEDARFVDLLGTPVQQQGESLQLTLAPRSSALLLSETRCTAGL
ncbi:MAG: alpha-amylase family glycosyl hydrolase [Myxococcota bacterium]|jgi:glycosidase|nr:alpha-amylase family glycosyl hydrolase [Myxococcota bacterium]